MKPEQFFIHKLNTIVGGNIIDTFQDETGFYFQTEEDEKWYKLSFHSADKEKVCEIEGIEKPEFNF